jgi:hypothetical protein
VILDIVPDEGATFAFTAIDPDESGAMTVAPDRALVVWGDAAPRTAPERSRDMNVWSAHFEIEVIYHARPNLQKILSDDSERIVRAVQSLDSLPDPGMPTERLYPDLRRLDVEPVGWAPGDHGRKRWLCDVEATYLLTFS